MNIKLLTEHHLEFLSLKMGCRGLSNSTLVKMPYYWKSHVMAQIFINRTLYKCNYSIVERAPGKFPITAVTTEPIRSSLCYRDHTVRFESNSRTFQGLLKKTFIFIFLRSKVNEKYRFKC